MELKDLKANPKNPRKISDDKLAMLKKSLGEFGDLSGIVFNQKTKQLVGGHQRLKVLPKGARLEVVKRFKKPTKVGTVAEGFVSIGDEKFSYREVNWDKLKEKAANLAANKGAGEWDAELLGEWFKELDMLDFDLNLTMFDEAERAAFLKDAEKVGLTDEDAVPTKPKKAKTVLGDVYQLGAHRLMCGDSTQIDSVEKLMAGEKADLWLTDPPYGVSYVAKNAAVHGGIVKNAVGKKIDNDEKTIGELKIFWRDVAASALIACSDEAAYYWFACQGGDQMMMMMSLGESDWLVRHELIWVKPSLVFGRSDYHYRHEPIIYGWKRKGKHHWYSDRKQTSVLEFERPHKSDLHPTTKPVELVEYLLGNSSKNGDLVLDTFGGSGTTLIACEKTNRKCFMMELDPSYCDVIVTRWEQFTGKKAKLLNAR